MAKSAQLIVLEAVDDRALAQLSAELCRWLRECGLAIKETHEPTCGPAGTQILLARQRRVQFDATSLALLHLADRLDHASRPDGIESWLAAGRHVICQHYGLAAAAWLWGQVAWDWLHRIDALCRVPDLTLFVDWAAEGSQQERLRQGYLAAIRRLRESDSSIRIIDGTQTPAQVRLACNRQVADLLGIQPAGLE